MCHDGLETKVWTVAKLGTNLGIVALVALASVGCSANSVHEGDKAPIEQGTPAPTPELPACILFCRDADGDAWGGGRTVSAGCEDETAVPPSGFAVCYDDCDDADASIYAWAAPDRDGDGFAPTGQTTSCIGALSEDQTYGALPGDCNDEDPSVSPGIREQWLDGVDSDCDGAEDPNDCSAEELDSTPVEIDPNCGDLPDLYVVRAFGCLPMCGKETPYVVVGNRGGSAIDAEVKLTSNYEFTADATSTIPLELGPGERSNPLALPGNGLGRLDFSVEFASAISECDPTNNVGQSGVGISDCI